MRKKAKSILKYGGGTNGAGGVSTLGTILKNNPLQGLGGTSGSIGAGSGAGSASGAGSGGSGFSMPEGMAVASNDLLMNIAGIEENSQTGVTLNEAAKWSDFGGSIVPGWGHLVGGLVGGTIGALKKGGVDNDGNIRYGGLFGHSKDYLLSLSNRTKNSKLSKQQTENVQADYYNENPTGNINIHAAEGGIMRRSVNALVSPGEIAIDPITLQYEQFGGGNEEPNSKDNISTILETGDIVRSHAKHMIMPNGKTSAENSKMVLDSNAPEEMKRVMIKKIGNWESAHRTKPQLYAKFSGGGIAGINKYGYNKNMSDFAYWDKEKNDYKKEYIDLVNNLTQDDVNDIFSGKYGDMPTYKSVNKNYTPTVEEARKLMTDKKYGDWHKIGKSFVDTKLNIENSNKTALKRTPNTIDITGLENGMLLNVYSENSPILYKINKIDEPLLKGVANPTNSLEIGNLCAADGAKDARKQLNSQNRKEWLNNISDLLPVVGGLFDKYDWHTELSQITPPRFVPVNTDPRPLLRAADESSSIGNYNLANMGVGTGAYMAHSAQLASDRAKRYADAHKWQQETNNKLIAQNAGIYNDWRSQRDAYVAKAIDDTRANEGAAQQMRDQARKDRLEFYYGKRNDDMLAAMMKPMFEYGTPDEAYKSVYKRRIL